MQQQQPGRRGDGGGGSCWYSGAAAGRQAGRQLPDEAVQARCYFYSSCCFF